MEPVLKSDIFFFVTTIAIVLLTIGGLIIIIYVWRIVRDVKDVSERVREQAFKVSEDIDEIRKSGFEGFVGNVMTIGKKLFKKHKKRNHEKKHKENNA